MGDDERFELTRQQRTWLESLSPERRHEMSDLLHGRWRRFRTIAESMDNVVDLLLPHARGEAATDAMTFSALGAEAFRAMARGEHERANELFKSAERYQDGLGQIQIVVQDKPDERG